MTNDQSATIFVCVTCGTGQQPAERPGQAMFQAVTDLLSARQSPGIVAKPVACLGVCKRPCTIALSGEDKWVYIVGDLAPETDAGDVIDAAQRYNSSADGIIPWRERPPSFRKGMVARVPPLGFQPESSDPDR